MTTISAISRRAFLNGLGAGVAAVAAPLMLPSRVWAAGAVTPSNKLNIARVGCGGRGHGILEEAESRTMMEQARAYGDYRELIAKEPSLDGVLIAIGPWWHAPMSTACIRAGKHVYCEKPLARLVSEARALGKLAQESKVATQMGTQGVASETCRRAIEVVQAGLLGKIREVHAWNVVHPKRLESRNRPDGEDPVPSGFNWDMWIGPSPERPYKRGVYGPGCMTSAMWFDFGAGLIGDFGTHTWQLPIRALKLGYPTHVEHNVPEPVKETYASNAKIRYEFPARGELPPVTGWYYDTINRPPRDVMEPLEKSFGKFDGVGGLLVGENGLLHFGGWSSGAYLKLKGDEKFRGISNHPAAKSIAQTEPRAPKQNHMLEWIEAAQNGTKPYQRFEAATHAMEITLTAIISLRMQRAIEWDGANMKVPSATEADKFIHADWRKKWLS
ncbi:MAG: Gfo/Idh/MocA family oxidoreductase [Kiritimatiellaeota bacterium]|nr:Gfo/Idh/MocA family oxidoreductase [Kiritimatiellota bacterium]